MNVTLYVYIPERDANISSAVDVAVACSMAFKKRAEPARSKTSAQNVDHAMKKDRNV